MKVLERVTKAIQEIKPPMKRAIIKRVISQPKKIKG